MNTPVQFPDWSDKKILIAEDLDGNYAVLSALLKLTKVQLFRAINGQEAIALMNQYKDVNVILMDISMPKMDGIEALRQIRQQMPHKIVIAQTAHAFSKVIADEEFDDYLQKPIRRNTLIELLSKYLS